MQSAELALLRVEDLARMLRNFSLGRLGAMALGTALLASPLAANVRDGVEAWSRGDYSAAVEEWRAPAEAGDADAMFNLGQAYRLGRGVPLDAARAEVLYERAARAGHVQAADTYGLMLFQAGRRAEALPYVENAARRGDPRAQYLLGIAHFNGDLVPRDWERAYALLTLANAAGLPQAAPAIAQMDETIPLAQREQGAALARQLESEAQSAREVELASADLGSVPAAGANSSPRIPRPLATTSVSPSIAAARAAVAEARRATGTESPADAGASYAPRPMVAVAAPPPAATPRRPAPAPAAAAAPASSGGPWRVQLGAFSVRANAEALWTRLARRAELAGHQRLLIPAGAVTKLQAGGFASQADAQAACRSLLAAGHACLVSRN
jgi:TPR repeat protein